MLTELSWLLVALPLLGAAVLLLGGGESAGDESAADTPEAEPKNS